MFTITRSFEFAAAHHLTAVPNTHKCARVHGHTYRVVLEAQAVDLDERGMVVDYAELDWIATKVRRVVDHRDLNEVLNGETTAEQIAVWIHSLARPKHKLVSVTVCESPRVTATYRP